MIRIARRASLSLLALGMGGCTLLGPDYQAPEPQLMEQWSSPQPPPVSSQSPTDPRWWRTAFNDPVLDRLVEQALEQNLDLRSAALRVLQSQQQLAIAIGSQYPQQQRITASAARERQNNVIFNDYNTGFNLSWELDLWGRFSRQIESAEAALEASVADYDGAMVSLVAQVAQNYLLIRTAQSRIDVALTNIRLQEEGLRIATAKLRAGEVSELDQDQAASLLANTQASLPALDSELQQLKNSLAVLLGTPPQQMNLLLTERGPIPVTEPQIALGMPQNLVRQRPDLRSAERQLAAQSARIGVAETDLYPSLTLGGTIGSEAAQTNQLFESDTKTWSVVGGFSWNILNYGRLKSNVRLQDARFQQLLEDYQSSVLKAQAEVESAIVAYLKSYEQLTYYQQAADASGRSVDISIAQYQNGAIDFNRVISTLSSDARQQDQLTIAKGNTVTSLVQLYRALGGGWEIREKLNPVELLPEPLRQQMRERTDAWEGVLQ
ncbi:efflux transporter outer membrane subunit [Aestuariirhabdus litorea]|uniref:Efflux transporter outer membrane subunit n=1 Tax=Aestuariirhabdus litorea TaxID=2528527 RepID=A0A3P3VMK2_9GAMM|nr:efflux transporter outer membrane subunit [Aestuariirhabdus litorea]RRJ83992.1 efflux transporter outer membrane subunit [Aestuariirhabdus litorea]RWW97212.1 efflux transporter outer membrane subunit [Endozoicomonadaceae bacterium GTF-13]